MSKALSNSEGYVYFNKQRKKWNACYPVYDPEVGKDKIKTKSFKSDGISITFPSSSGLPSY